MPNCKVKQEAVRFHLRQTDISQALKLFLALPEVETDCYVLLETVLHDWYIAGLFDTQILLAFFSELPKPKWTLNGLDVYSIRSRH